MAHSLTDDLALAHALVDLAAEVAFPYFHRGVTFDAKSDGSPVSEADREVERQMLDLLRRERPQDSVLGEETGQRGRGSRRWIIDPIDGTFNFVEGDAVWAPTWPWRTAGSSWSG